MSDKRGTLLSPRSIAVVGASNDINRVGGRPIHFLRNFGFEGAIYPINPNRDEVQELKAFPDIAALPDVPDLVIIALPAAGVEAVVDACIARGVPNAIIMSSGFGETGPVGRDLEEAISRRAREAGLRLIGPNSQGVANFRTGALASFSTVFMEIPPQDGPVAVVSQSGAFSAMLYALLRQTGYGLRYLAATGNEADLTTADLIHMVLDDGDIQVLLVYLETLKNTVELAKALERARTAGVAVVAMKTGTSEQGALSASSHTGAMATESGVVSAFFRSHGVWEVRSTRDLFDAVPLYLKAKDPGPGRLGVLSHSGAVCVICADAAERYGLELAALTPETQRKLEDIMPAFVTLRNPVDLTAGLIGNPTMFHDSLSALAEDPNVDIVHVGIPIAGPGYDIAGFAADIAKIEEETGKSITVAAPQSSVRETLSEGGVFAYDDDVTALTAIRQFVEHRGLMLRKPCEARPVAFALGNSAGAILDEAESLAILASAGVRTVEHAVCDTKSQAEEAYARFGGRVVVKGCSVEVPHKSEHGLVHLGLSSGADVAAATEDCLSRMAAMGVSGRVIVAPMIGGRREMVVGAKRDASVGPVVMIGDGGKYVEVLKDTVLLVPPFSAEEAVEAMTRLRIWAILTGARGEPPMDVEAVAKSAALLGEMMLSEPRIESVDMNPVLVSDEDKGAVVLDALITLLEGSGA